MAPEMAAGAGARIDERTDVYLRGAILHQCITGRPRHEGKDPAEVLLRAYRSEPVQHDRSVPAELTEICNKATHVDPAERYGSADELRKAIVGFKRHRHSTIRGQEASVRLDSRRLLISADDEHDDLQIHKLFSECRFGYHQALRTWPGNAEARTGLEDTLSLMAGHHVSREDHRSAALLVKEMENPPAELEKELAGLGQRLARREQHVSELERLEQEMDLDVGRRTRAAMALVVAILYTVMPALEGLAARRGVENRRKQSGATPSNDSHPASLMVV